MSSKKEGKFDSPSATELELLRRIAEDLARLLQQNQEDQNSIKLDLTPDGLRIQVFDRSLRPVFEKDSVRFTSYGTWIFSTLAWEIARFSTFQIDQLMNRMAFERRVDTRAMRRAAWRYR